MIVAQLMTADPQIVSPDDTLRHAAALMGELDVGVLPVCRDGRLVGVITDRDITVRATAAGQPPEQTQVNAAMTDEVRYCYEDDDVADAERIMQEAQIRRLPVITREGHLAGIVSLGDLATSPVGGVRDTLEQVSQPTAPDR